MTTIKKTLALLAMTLSVPAVALADPPGPAEYTVGARVGGYGFRQAPTSDHDHSGWNDCRMNGIGLFGEKRLGKALFVEAGLDTYFAEQFPTGGLHEHDSGVMAEEPMDRVSGLASIAGGVRLNEGGRVSPYLQVGAGLELTRVSMPAYDMEESFVMPIGFFGIGGDLRLGKRLRLGANFRVHLMGHFDHGAGTTSMDAEPELAAQGQFYAKWDL